MADNENPMKRRRLLIPLLFLILCAGLTVAYWASTCEGR